MFIYIAYFEQTGLRMSTKFDGIFDARISWEKVFIAVTVDHKLIY